MSRYIYKKIKSVINRFVTEFFFLAHRIKMAINSDTNWFGFLSTCNGRCRCGCHYHHVSTLAIWIEMNICNRNCSTIYSLIIYPTPYASYLKTTTRKPFGIFAGRRLHPPINTWLANVFLISEWNQMSLFVLAVVWEQAAVKIDIFYMDWDLLHWMEYMISNEAHALHIYYSSSLDSYKINKLYLSGSWIKEHRMIKILFSIFKFWAIHLNW